MSNETNGDQAELVRKNVLTIKAFAKMSESFRSNRLARQERQKHSLSPVTSPRKHTRNDSPECIPRISSDTSPSPSRQARKKIVTSGAGARGTRRGRGVRVLLPAPDNRKKAKGPRGGRANRRPGPSSIDELIISDISEMPVGEGLETPLRPKIVRVWQPTITSPIPPEEADSVSAASPRPATPSPIMFLECGSSSLMKVESPLPSPQMSNEDYTIVNDLNFGSDDSTDASDEEMTSTFIPRSKRSMLETPMDEDVPEHPSDPIDTTIDQTIDATIDQTIDTTIDQTIDTTIDQTIDTTIDQTIDTTMNNEDDIVFDLNFGSDDSTDASDEEMTPTFIPRAYRSMLETPMDEDVPEHPSDQTNDTTIDQTIDTTIGQIIDTTMYQTIDITINQTIDTTINQTIDQTIDTTINPTIDTTINQTPDTTALEVALKDHQPSSFYQFDWKTFPNPPIPPETRREVFSESNGPTIPDVDPYNIFIAIWDRQIMDYIAKETNRYAQQVAQQMIDNNVLTPNSRISRWVDTTADELYLYFGIIIAMGIVIKSRIDEYWNTNADIFCTPGFRAYMSINRFLLLNRNLHFNDNKKMRASELSVSEAKLYKIQPILSHLNKKFQTIYKLSQNIALDESLLQWKGWLDINQIIPNKAAAMGIKSYEICESQTGYLWRFEIHAHKSRKQEDSSTTSISSIVSRLSHGLEFKGHTIWMDNFYNSPSLARRLKSTGIDCVGTLRTNRQFVPKALDTLNKFNMRKGEIAGLTSGDVDVMVWRDNNRVAMISTYHGNAAKQLRGSTKPILILDYNIMMGGVDKKDQMLAMYPIERKRGKIWYKKLFKRLLNVSVLNSYIIHNHKSHISHRNFRIALVKSLLANHSSAHVEIPPVQIPPVVRQNLLVEVTHRPEAAADVTHRIAEYPLIKSYRKRRVCKVCKKRVYTFCVACNKTVCIDPCFLIFHTST